MKDLAIQKSFLQEIETTSPNFGNYIPMRGLFGKYLNKLNAPFYDICCPTASTSAPVRFFEGNIQYFDGETWASAGVGPGAVGTLQQVTDTGNTTDNQIASSFIDNYAYQVEREGVFFGTGFTIEAGGTGWGGTYLGGSLEYTISPTTDKANIYIGLAAGQARVQGGEFGTFLGYQAGLGHDGSDYKFYLAQGSNNHLMYGDFFTGDLWIKSRVKIGQTFDGTGPSIPADPEARLDIIAGSTTVAPLKFTAGTNLTTPVNGAFEFDGVNLYITIAGVRRTIALVP